MGRPRGTVARNNVCEFCRRRKVKCDKMVPCSACVKHGNPICEYPKNLEPSISGRSHSSETITLISLPKKKRRTAKSSKSSPDESQPTPATSSDMAQELEYLKRQVSLLEKSVSSTDPHNVGRSGQPIWRNPTAGDLNFMICNNPFLSDSQFFSFQNSYVPFIAMGQSDVRHYYPLTWVSLLKIDSALASMFSFKHLGKKNRAVIEKPHNDDSPAIRVFGKKLSEFIDEDTEFEATKTSIKSSAELNQKAKIVGMTLYEGNLDAEASVVSKALLLLPTKKVIWLLIDRFFQRVYPFYPFLDQNDFENQVKHILGSSDTDHEKVTELCVKKKLNLVNLGILLLVLRFAHLTLFQNDLSINEAIFNSSDPSLEIQEHKFLMNHPIDIDVVQVAQQCLNHLGYLRYANLSILQLSMYLKLYNAYAPENGEGADDANTRGYTSQVIDFARNLGLHREPDNFRVKIREKNINNLCRKIWWFLVMHDLTGAVTNGTPLVIKRCEFDTKTPFHKPGNENCRNSLLETQLSNCYANFGSCYEKIVKVVEGIGDLSTPIRMRDLCGNITDLEQSILDYLDGWTTEYVLDSTCLVAEYTKAIQTKVGFESRFFMVSICHHFFNYYEKMDKMDMAYFYLKKIFAVAFHKMIPFYRRFVDMGAEIFKYTTEIHIAPTFQTLIHKCTIVIHSVLIRARFSIMQCEGLPTHLNDLATNNHYKKRYQLLVETWDLCNMCLKIFHVYMQKLGARYFYCWRYCKVQERLRQIRSGTDFYLNWCKGKETYMKLTNEMLEDFNEVLRNSLEGEDNNQMSGTSISLYVSMGQSQGGNSDAQPPSFGMCYNSPVTMDPSCPFNNNASSDSIWLLLLSMKPEKSNPVLHNQAIPFDYSMPLSGLDTFANPEEGPEFLPDDPVAGAYFMESFYENIAFPGL